MKFPMCSSRNIPIQNTTCGLKPMLDRSGLDRPLQCWAERDFILFRRLNENAFSNPA